MFCLVPVCVHTFYAWGVSAQTWFGGGEQKRCKTYFHRLWIGRPWGRWLCGPPIDLPKRSGGVTSMSVYTVFGPSE